LGEETSEGATWDKAFSNEVAKWVMTTIFHHQGKEPEYGAIQWELAAGDYTLQVSGRSEGFSVDRFYLHHYGVGHNNPHVAESQRIGYAFDESSATAPQLNVQQGPLGFSIIADYDLVGNDIA
jgi:hypothetical protein